MRLIEYLAAEVINQFDELVSRQFILLIEINFIDREKIGRKYYFRVNPVPEHTEEVLQLANELEKEEIKERKMKKERISLLREKLINKMPIDEEFIFGEKKDKKAI